MKAALCCIVKNEADIFEWCLFHHHIGFDTMIVFNNGSTDSTLDELAQAGRFADVRIIDWSLHPGQHQSYEYALTRFGDGFDWMGFVDADEFIVPVAHDGIRPFLAGMAEHPAISLSWLVYGSAGHVARPDSLITEAFEYRSTEAFSPNLHMKSIVQPRLLSPTARFVNPHCMADVPYVTASGQSPEWVRLGKTTQVHDIDEVRINHYYTRSQWSFDQKLSRGRATTKLDRVNNFQRFDQNEVFDPIVRQRYRHIQLATREAKRAIAGERGMPLPYEADSDAR